jgi:hypothetical protein
VLPLFYPTTGSLNLCLLRFTDSDYPFGILKLFLCTTRTIFTQWNCWPYYWKRHKYCDTFMCQIQNKPKINHKTICQNSPKFAPELWYLSPELHKRYGYVTKRTRKLTYITFCSGLYIKVIHGSPISMSRCRHVVSDTFLIYLLFVNCVVVMHKTVYIYR